MSDIEKEFDSVAGEINLKINEAAKALKQANTLAKKHGLKILHIHPQMDMSDYGIDSSKDRETHYEVLDRISFDSLMNELDNAGWHTSSLDC